MAIAAGKECYNCDSGSVRARGMSLSMEELKAALEAEVAQILADYQGKQELTELFAGLAATGFEEKQLNSIVETQVTVYDWRVGEGLAEAYLASHKDCEYPWPGGRDLKNPAASAAGTDLVGLQTLKTDSGFRFSFGEVKTSNDQAYPPSVMYGRSGLKQQLEALRDDVGVRHALVRYLALHATNAPWKSRFQAAARKYLKDNSDVTLFGVLVRDIVPHADDLKARAARLNEDRPLATRIELLAIYIPSGAISRLPEMVKNSDGAK